MPASALPDCLLDGEIVALDRHGLPSFSALQSALVDEDTADLVYFVFDLLFAVGVDLRRLPLAERKKQLFELLDSEKTSARLRYVEHFETAADALLRSACRMSLEGVVSKRLNAPYRSGRGDTWLKTKCRAGHEVVIGGWTKREGQLRSFLAGVYDGRRLRYVGRIGTGFGREIDEGTPAETEGAREREKPIQRRRCATQVRRSSLASARARRRNRVRRLDGLRDDSPGRVQGVARRQARARGGRGKSRESQSQGRAETLHPCKYRNQRRTRRVAFERRQAALARRG